MKKLLFLLLFSLEGNAQTTHRITAGMNLQDAITNASSGDFYLEEGGVQVTNLDIDKEVAILERGCFLIAEAQMFSKINCRHLLINSFLPTQNNTEFFFELGKLFMSIGRG